MNRSGAIIVVAFATACGSIASQDETDVASGSASAPQQDALSASSPLVQRVRLYDLFPNGEGFSKVANDAAGNIYVAGSEVSHAYPHGSVANGFLAKLSSGGDVLWTYNFPQVTLS